MSANPMPDGGTAVGQPPGGPPGRRRARVLVISAAVMSVLVAGAAAAVTVTARGDGAAQPRSTLPPHTARVVTTTLVATKKVDGTLGYSGVTDLAGRLGGTVTAITAAGQTVDRGQVLYAVDDRPVVLLFGPKPAYRPLTIGTKGPDVRQLEENLRTLGHTTAAPDESFTAATATAVKAWQRKLGLEPTGELEVGRVVFLPGPVRINEHKARVGDAAQPGSPVLSYSGTERVVTVDLDVRLQKLAVKDAEVRVTLPDGTQVDGVVTDVGTVVKKGEGNGSDGRSTITVTVRLADQGAAGGLVHAPVSVTFVSEERRDVLAVPIAALLALREGGYGVQVVENGTARTVNVELGMFAGGLVELRGGGVAEGDEVGVPAP